LVGHLFVHQGPRLAGDLMRAVADETVIQRNVAAFSRSTFAPSSAMRVTQARLMSTAPPVTMAVFPTSLFVVVVLSKRGLLRGSPIEMVQVSGMSVGSERV
jgi:hypothetical protein